MLFALIALLCWSGLQAQAKQPGPEGEILEPGQAPQIILLADDRPDGPTRYSPPPPSFQAGALEQTATIHINYLPSQAAWPDSARASLEYAASIWESQIDSPVVIEMEAEWAGMSSGALGGATAYYYLSDTAAFPFQKTWYPLSLANRLSGRDLRPGSPDIYAMFNSSFPDWYFGTGSATPANKWDFASVALHEIGHGLGFGGSMSAGSADCGGVGLGCWGWGTSAIYPFAYDHFTVDGAGRKLIDTSVYGNPSLELGAQLTGGQIFLNSSQAVAGNGGVRPPLYAPSNWRPGSSYVHLAESFNNTPNALMTYSISPGETQHNPGPIIMGFLQDLGWAYIGPKATPTPTAIPLDNFEPDDTCGQATQLAPAFPQDHNFYPASDADWARFEVETGVTYVIQALSTHPSADLSLELYDSCGGNLVDADQNPYSLDGRLTFTAPRPGTYRVQVANQNPAQAGATYRLTVRIQPAEGAALIVAGSSADGPYQAEIIASANRAYRTFQRAGFDVEHLRYLAPDSSDPIDADGDAASDVYTTTTKAALSESIAHWAAHITNAQTPFYLYLAGYGGGDSLVLNSEDDPITPAHLDNWLSLLETNLHTPVTVILDAGRSGTFIDEPDSIARLGRVVITSTNNEANAYPNPGTGFHFSDAFFTALGQNMDLFAAFQYAEQAVGQVGLNQAPWLEDSGDFEPNGPNDGSQARQRGLANLTFPPDYPPLIDETDAPRVMGPGPGSLQVRVKDDYGLKRVWALVYPPSVTEPLPVPSGSIPALETDLLSLADPEGDGLWAGTYPNFTQPGPYRLVVYAEDLAGNLSQPVQMSVCWNCTTYLPALQRR